MQETNVGHYCILETIKIGVYKYETKKVQHKNDPRTI